MSELPGGYTLVERADERLALASHCSDELARAGYAFGQDPPLRESALSGRKPLFEFDVASGRLVVRRFSHGGLLRVFTGSRFQDPERPFEELRVANELVRRGIRTPEIVAARARRARAGGWRLEIVTRRVEHALDLELVLERARSAAIEPRRLRSIVRATGSFVRALHAAGQWHADLTTKNMLLEEAALAGGTPCLWILDLDRARIEAPLTEARRLENLQRLLRFVLRREELGRRALRRSDFARFLVAYEPERTRRRALWRTLLREHARRGAWHRLGWSLERHFGGRDPARGA
jgi:3-deoxy-D-manno-octulosonic acid kinase